MSIEQAAAPAAAGTSSAWRGYRHYVLAILTLVYVVNYLDRQILAVILHPIQLEFHLSGAQLGFLSGTAFAVVYATLGVPLAIFADRMNRRNIIAVSLATFSLMTVFCGMAARFWQLVLARFGTGIGEAGTTPSINSIIADYYPPERRATALSFYSAGLNIGLLLGFFGGGWIAQKYGWREAFLVAGMPGLLLALVVLATIREPLRGSADQALHSGAAPPFWSVVRYLFARPSFRWFSLATGMNAFGGYAVVSFFPTFLQTTHRMSLVQSGIALALLAGVPGALGTFFAGVFADRFGRSDRRALALVPMIGAAIAIPFAPLVYLSSSLAVVLAAAVVPSLMGAIYVGPGLAAVQAMVSPRMRATTVALFLFILNIIGLGLGPLTVGWVSDLLRPALGADSLRWALMTNVVSGTLAVLCYWRASRTLTKDIARAQQLP
jgi:predicted MFS family arabinose efflux permease